MVRAMIVQLENKMSLAFEKDTNQINRNIKRAKLALDSLSKEEKKLFLLVASKPEASNERK